jgi:hypothetical protein
MQHLRKPWVVVGKTFEKAAVMDGLSRINAVVIRTELRKLGPGLDPGA